MRLRIPLAALSIVAFAGCAHDSNPSLARAEAEYQDAANDPFVAEHAPLSLEDAQRALDEGRRAERRGESDEEIDHLAYVASRRVEIARLAAERHADVERAEGLARTREHGDTHVHVAPSEGSHVYVGPSADPHVHVAPAPDSHVHVAPRDEPHAHAPSSASISAAFFEPERAALSEADRRELERVADLIVSRPERWVRIEGHADETESDALRLSEERAHEVADELVEEGVDRDRLSVRGYGAADPAASSDTATGRQRNRRVEIVLSPVVGAR